MTKLPPPPPAAAGNHQWNRDSAGAVVSLDDEAATAAAAGTVAVAGAGAADDDLQDLAFGQAEATADFRPGPAVAAGRIETDTAMATLAAIGRDVVGAGRRHGESLNDGAVVSEG